MLPDPAGAATVTGGAAARLDIASLIPTVFELFTAGLASSTQRVYRAGGKQGVSGTYKFVVHMGSPLSQ